MFDIGFWELVVIAVVALVIFGPEEFPTLIRNAASGVGKVRRFVSAMKADLDFEFQRADELKRLMEQEAKLAELDDLPKDTGGSVAAAKPVSAAVESREQNNNEFDKQRATEDPAKAHHTGSSSGAGQA